MEGKTFTELVAEEGVAAVSRAVGRSRRFIHRVLQGERLVGRKLMVDVKRAYPEFSADADIVAEIEGGADVAA